MKELLVYQFETTINAPIELVFECLSKDEHVYKWNSMIVENVYDGKEEDIKVGSKYISKQVIDKKELSIEAEVIEHNPPYAAGVQAKTKEGLSITKYYLSEEEFGTKVVVKASLVPSNFFYKLATKMTGWMMKYIFNEQYEKLVEYIYTLSREAEYNSNSWHVTYFNDEHDFQLYLVGVINENKKWDVFLEHNETEFSIEQVTALGYERDEEYGVKLFEANNFDDAYDKVEEWAEKVYIPKIREQ